MSPGRGRVSRRSSGHVSRGSPVLVCPCPVSPASRTVRPMATAPGRVSATAVLSASTHGPCPAMRPEPADPATRSCPAGTDRAEVRATAFRPAVPGDQAISTAPANPHRVDRVTQAAPSSPAMPGDQAICSAPANLRTAGQVGPVARRSPAGRVNFPAYSCPVSLGSSRTAPVPPTMRASPRGSSTAASARLPASPASSPASARCPLGRRANRAIRVPATRPESSPMPTARPPAIRLPSRVNARHSHPGPRRVLGSPANSPRSARVRPRARCRAPRASRRATRNPSRANAPHKRLAPRLDRQGNPASSPGSARVSLGTHSMVTSAVAYFLAPRTSPAAPCPVLTVGSAARCRVTTRPPAICRDSTNSRRTRRREQ